MDVRLIEVGRQSKDSVDFTSGRFRRIPELAAERFREIDHQPGEASA